MQYILEVTFLYDCHCLFQLSACISVQHICKQHTYSASPVRSHMPTIHRHMCTSDTVVHLYSIGSQIARAPCCHTIAVPMMPRPRKPTLRLFSSVAAAVMAAALLLLPLHRHAAWFCEVKDRDSYALLICFTA